MNNDSATQILVVEDDEDSRELLLAFLGSEGFDVVGACSAEEGLQALGSRNIAFLITDYRLPGQDGLWLLREAEAQGLLQRVSVLFCSGEVETERLGGVRCLKKPLDLEQLLLEIDQGLAATYPKLGQTRLGSDGDGKEGE